MQRSSAQHLPTRIDPTLTFQGHWLLFKRTLYGIPTAYLHDLGDQKSMPEKLLFWSFLTNLGT